jgi:hypothetical protein
MMPVGGERAFNCGFTGRGAADCLSGAQKMINDK